MVFPSGYQAHAATETCPGHSTILTGARPGRTGIVANNWFDQGAARADKYIYCAEDERVPGSTSENYTVSAVHLRVPTLGDLMRRADPAQPRRRRRRQGPGGGDDGRPQSEPALVVGRRAPSSAMPASPSRARSPRSTRASPRRCRAPASRCRSPKSASRAAAPIAVPGRATPVGTGRFARAADDRYALRASPEFDALHPRSGRGDARRDAARRGPGHRSARHRPLRHRLCRPRLRHAAAPRCASRCSRSTARSANSSSISTASGSTMWSMLTADHGGLDLPERSREQAGGAAARVDPALNATRDGRGARPPARPAAARCCSATARSATCRSTAPCPRGPARESSPRRCAPIAPTRRSPPSSPAPRSRRRRCPSGPPDSWTILQRARASFDPLRSGDFYVMLKPRITPIADASRGSVATHGSVWDYDRRVPILFWRRGMTAFEQPLGGGDGRHHADPRRP